jgi:hypothetical protein
MRATNATNPINTTKMRLGKSMCHANHLRYGILRQLTDWSFALRNRPHVNAEKRIDVRPLRNVRW